MKFTSTTNMTKADIFNAQSNAQPLQKCDKPVTVRAVGVADDVSNDTGEVVTVGIIVTTDNEIFGTISKTVVDTFDILSDMLNDGESPTIRVNRRKSNAGREFLTLGLME